MDRIKFEVGAAGHAGCPGENGCQFKTSSALLLREGAKAKPGGRSGHLTGERRKNGTQPDTGRMLRKAASLQGWTGAREARASRVAPDVANFTQAG